MGVMTIVLDMKWFLDGGTCLSCVGLWPVSEWLLQLKTNSHEKASPIVDLHRAEKFELSVQVTKQLLSMQGNLTIAI